MALRVGPGGDIEGLSDKTLQAGVDYLHRLGGGTLHIHPGQHRMHNALYLRPEYIQGSGQDSVLIKEPSACSEPICDSDWHECRVRRRSHGFSPGMRHRTAQSPRWRAAGDKGYRNSSKATSSI